MVEFLIVRRWEKRCRTNLYREGFKMLLLCVSSTQYRGIGAFWHAKTWYSSKIRYCLIFLVKMCWFFVWIIYVEDIRTVFHRKLYMKTHYSSKIFSILGSKSANTPYTTDTSRPKCVDSYVNNIYIWSIRTVSDRKLYMKTCYDSKS